MGAGISCLEITPAPLRLQKEILVRFIFGIKWMVNIGRGFGEPIEATWRILGEGLIDSGDSDMGEFSLKPDSN